MINGVFTLSETESDTRNQEVNGLYETAFTLTKTIGGSRGGRARRAPPHLPGILVFDDILGHIV